VAVEKGGRPFGLASMRPIQLSTRGVLQTLADGRHQMTTDEWRRLLLRSVGFDMQDPMVRRAVAWLRQVQQSCGGWGETCRSYDDPSLAGKGTPTASQTAWALLALHAAGEASSDAAARGIEWLCSKQRPDGTWDEHQYTGTGFPGDFYINYHLYRLVFPVMALGRCVEVRQSS